MIKTIRFWSFFLSAIAHFIFLQFSSNWLKNLSSPSLQKVPIKTIHLQVSPVPTTLSPAQLAQVANQVKTNNLLKREEKIPDISPKFVKKKKRDNPLPKRNRKKQQQAKKIRQTVQQKIQKPLPIPALPSEQFSAKTQTTSRIPQQLNQQQIQSQYLSRLKAKINHHKYYPRLSRRRGEEGRVLASLQINADGKFHDIRIEQSSGYQRLDEAVIKTLHQIESFDPLPIELGLTQWSIQVPLFFQLN